MRTLMYRYVSGRIDFQFLLPRADLSIANEGSK